MTFERVWAEVYPKILHSFRSSTGHQEDAEDLAMEAFTRAWIHRNRMEKVQNPQGWLMRVAQRAKQDRLKVQLRRWELAQFISLESEVWEGIAG